MTRRNGQVVISSCCALLCAAGAYAQGGRGGSDWATAGNDAQRSGWVRTDAKISLASMEKPGFAFLWKQKLASDPKQLNSLTEAVLLDRYIGYRGFRSLAHVGASGNKIVGLDTDLGRVEWTKSLGGAPSQSGTLACPGGLTTSLARPIGVAIATAPAGRGGGGGRGGPAKSGVGEPGAGAVTLAAIAAQPQQGGGGRGAQPGAPGAPPAARGGGGQQRMPSFVYALSSDGKLHAMYVSNGDEPNPAVAFLPANANAVGLTVTDGVAYVATINGCGGAPNGVWALDLNSKQVTSWKTSSSISGTSGFAFSPDGTLYAGTTGGELVALEPKTLRVLATYNAGAPGFASTPAIFDYNNKPLIAIAAKDGSVHVLNATLGTAIVKSPAASSTSDVPAGALATWQDSDGTRWILAPSAGSVGAWKLADQAGTMSLTRGWASRDMVSPLPPMVMNGVVFAVSSGEFRSKDATTPAQVAQKSAKAVLYALDGKTGKELWNSGNTITSFVHSGGLSGGGSQLYLQTFDGTLYAFGFPIEH
ncbi:MAG TPA: PQQ-binding-like beta-propeller repeat protein [Candidatus Acidoferrum sp.]|nr:PQQ-binding-like beta-propeller repeat protein [Candidatus Acidoferrum sp.]